ncbi:MAG: hypothetical protein II837_10005, partial [Treponema sp.]|nr:hypothetical protein [Treponema sp.]
KPCGKPIPQAPEGAEKLRAADFSARISKFLVPDGYKGRIRSLISVSLDSFCSQVFSSLQFFCISFSWGTRKKKLNL